MADSETIHVSTYADTLLVGRRAKTALAELEFSDAVVEEIVLVVHELASNIVKHAGEGSISLAPCSTADRSGIEVRAEDSGPGIADIQQAVTDGYSTVGSLGGGLGTVHRLMDTVTISSNGDSNTGVAVVAIRWCADSTLQPTDPPLVVGAATRAKPGHEYNGDAFIIEHGKSRTLVGVIDGIGHGSLAHRASRAAREYVQTHSDRSISSLFEGVERVSRSTRGVVMALARFDWDAEAVTVGSVGNINVKIHDPPRSNTVVTPRGVLGGDAPPPAIKTREWRPSCSMVLHSDGLATRWSWDEFSHLESTSVTHTARELLRSLSKETDDATVLVARGAER